MWLARNARQVNEGGEAKIGVRIGGDVVDLEGQREKWLKRKSCGGALVLSKLHQAAREGKEGENFSWPFHCVQSRISGFCSLKLGGLAQ